MVIGYSILKGLGLKSNLIAVGLATAWFFRLSGFIFYNRIWKRHVDPRYEEMRKNKNDYLYYFFQFQLQAVLTVFTAVPLYYALGNTISNPLNLLGVGLCIAGILGEALADQQLQKFKNSKPEKGAVFREGLFKYSRHPNLFFDLTFWTGMAFIGINFTNYCSVISLLGPAFLWFIMYKLTIPITTKHMKKTRPNYEKVIAETHTFWPFTPKTTMH